MTRYRGLFVLAVLLAGTFAQAGEAPPRAAPPAKRPVKTPANVGKGKKDTLNLPDVNRKVMEFCEANLGKRVGDGECAVLAAEALADAGAKHRREFEAPLPNMTADDYVWGKLLQPRDQVLPGDILQFRDVKLKFTFPNGASFTQTFDHHTAVVYRVFGPGQFTILQQNVGGPGATEEQRRTVQVGGLDVRGMQKGTIWAYRPVEKGAE